MFLCWPPTRVRFVVSDFERSTSCRHEWAGSGRLHRLSYCQSSYTKASYVSAVSERIETTPFTHGEGQGTRWHPKFFQLTTVLSDSIIPVDSVLPRLKYLLNLFLVGATGTETPPVVWMYISWWMRRLEGVFHDALHLCRIASSKLQPRATISMHLNWIDI